MSIKPDPSTVAAAVPIVASTPFLGEFGIIVLAALFGAMVSLSRRQIERRKGYATLFMFRAVCLASFTTGAAASWLSARTGIEFYRLLWAVAFLIAYVGDDWAKVKDWAIAKWFSPKQ